MKNIKKNIVNPIAVHQCYVAVGETRLPLLDISYVRTVADPQLNPNLELGMEAELEIALDRFQFHLRGSLVGKGETWARFDFLKLPPSSRACLRTFLSAKKIGESLIQDWREGELTHYHGLNESEMWYEPRKAVVFTYLDLVDFSTQFILRWSEEKGEFNVGLIGRKDYFELTHLDADLPLIPLNDRDIYTRLSECRDIVTNFRAVGNSEAHLKQRLLKVMSENLYSTSRRVEMNQWRARMQRGNENQPQQVT